MRAAVLRNPRSTRNRDRSRDLALGWVQVLAPETLTELEASLEVLASEGLDLLIIDGGDGTVREVISRLPELFREPPLLGILAHGNTNLIARKLGAVRDLEALLSQDVNVLHNQARPAHFLRFEFGDRPAPVRGFVAGWAAYARGTEIAQREIAVRGSRQVLRAVLATARRALFGPEATLFRRGAGAGFEAPGEFETDRPAFLGILTTLNGRLTGGLAPFWGTGTGPLRWSWIEAPPRRLWLRLFPAAFGRPGLWAEADGYRSGRAEQLLLRDPGSVIIDGEAFPAPSGSIVLVSGTETLRFVSN